MNWFYESAVRYKLTGKSLEDLCDYNARVAATLDRQQVLPRLYSRSIHIVSCSDSYN